MEEPLRPCQMDESSLRKDCGQISPIADFEIEDGVLKEYLGNAETVVIPAGVTSIGKGAFARCKSLKSIHIPNGVTSIEAFAFYHCSALTSVHIPDGVTSIGYEAFSDCKATPRNRNSG